MEHKTKKGLMIATGAFVAMAGAASLWLNQPSEELSIPELKTTDQAIYNVTYRAMMSNGQEKTDLANFAGDLRQYPQDKDWVSEWQAIEYFTMDGSPREDVKISFVDKPTLSSFSSEGINHFIAPEFPKFYLGFQVNVLNKLYVPFELVEDKTFSRREIDEISAFDVNYQVKKTSTGYSVSRSWASEVDSAVIMDDKFNSIAYTYDKSGRLAKAFGTLVFRNAQNTQLVYRTDVLIELKKAEAQVAGRAPVDPAQLKRYDAKTALAEAQAADPSRYVPNTEEIYERIKTFTDKTDAQDRFYLYADLSNDLERNPENLPRLVKEILDINERDESSQRRATVLFSVLAGNSTQESARALAKLATTDCPDDFCRMQAVMAHGMHQNPAVDSAKDILSVARTAENPEVAGNAYLSVGSSGNKLGDKYPDLSSTMIDDFNAPDREPVKTMIIKAMGNHGQKEYLPILKDALKSEDHIEKTSSIFSMRFVQEDDVIPTLLSVVETEESDLVRTKALNALSYRPIAKSDYQKIAEIGLKGDATDELTVAKFIGSSYRNYYSESYEAMQHMLAQVKSEDAKRHLETVVEEVDKAVEVEQGLLEE